MSVRIVYPWDAHMTLDCFYAMENYSPISSMMIILNIQLTVSILLNVLNVSPKCNRVLDNQTILFELLHFYDFFQCHKYLVVPLSPSVFHG